FGRVGTWAWHIARAHDAQPPVAREHHDQIWVEYVWDEPVQRLESLLLAAEQVAIDLEERLNQESVRCAKVRICARTETGDSLERLWRTDVVTRRGAFVPHMTDRVRWQMEGWLTGTSHGPQAAALMSLRVYAEDVVALG